MFWNLGPMVFCLSPLRWYLGICNMTLLWINFWKLFLSSSALGWQKSLKQGDFVIKLLKILQQTFFQVCSQLICLWNSQITNNFDKLVKCCLFNCTDPKLKVLKRDRGPCGQQSRAKINFNLGKASMKHRS